jgi:small basic protein
MRKVLTVLAIGTVLSGTVFSQTVPERLSNFLAEIIPAGQ